MPETAAVEVKIADLPQVKAIMRRLPDALALFAGLGDEERAALPEAVRQGIDVLAGAEADAGTVRVMKPDGCDYWGYVIIEWPAPDPRPEPRSIPGWKCSLINALSGERFYTCRKIEIHADAGNCITADLTMFADADGKPVFDGDPVRAPDGSDGPVFLEGIFPFLVSEMRVREGGR